MKKGLKISTKRTLKVKNKKKYNLKKNNEKEKI
jgi:hypothetical protein